jgi:hypothetical protein
MYQVIAFKKLLLKFKMQTQKSVFQKHGLPAKNFGNKNKGGFPTTFLTCVNPWMMESSFNFLTID